MTRAVRIFLDANILFSAAKSDGPIRALIERLLDAGHECRVDGYVIDEARRNISAKAASQMQSLDALLSRVHVAATSPATLGADIEGLPEKDRPVVAAAKALSCEILVTGDRTHFGRFYGRFLHGVRIQSPRSLYDHFFPKR
ncbi:MAG: PIN domain-containing protein [Planctomycetes bacterium]|nr:PIN domain-containing protein [Planctomycetota bacterium]MBM4057346.1 PIN domain-containing protein [Planctomycetota bacterium]